MSNGLVTDNKVGRMRHRVLIIDDSPLIAAFIRARLADEPIDFLESTDGAQGIDLATEAQPEMVLCDVDMPNLDGFAVCAELKRRDATMHIPLVLMAGTMAAELKIKALNLGAADFLTKPIDPADLLARVRSTLRTAHLLDLLAKKAQVDGLTGLWNRAYFGQRLASEISLSQRTHAPISCVIADIDGLRSINDRFGHAAGDNVICRTGEILFSCVRLEDILCRQVGGTFAVIMPNIPTERAAIVAERMRKALLSARVEVRGERLNLTASFGVAAATTHVDQSLDNAEGALGRAKRGGRNRIELASPPLPMASAS